MNQELDSAIHGNKLGRLKDIKHLFVCSCGHFIQEKTMIGAFICKLQIVRINTGI